VLIENNDENKGEKKEGFGITKTFL